MKKITRRNFLKAAATCGAVATLAACGGTPSESTSTENSTQESQGTSDSSTGDSAANVNIRFSWWGSEVRHNATLAAIEAYQAANPGVTIEGEYSGYDGYQDKLMAQVAGGNAPDIFTSVTEWYPSLFEANAMMDITGAFDMSGHSDAIIEACSYEGAVYGVSVSLNAHGFTYNATLAEELGVTIPASTDAYTWDDLMALGLEAYEKSGGEVYGFLDPRQTGEALPIYGYTVLGKSYPYMWSETELTITAEDFANYQAYFQNQPEGVILPPEESYVVDGMTYAPVAHRDTLFDSCSLGTFAIFQSQTEDSLAVLPFPKGPNGEQGDAARPGLILNVFESADEAVKAEAVKFLDWFSNSPEAAVILGSTRGVLPTEVQRNAAIEGGVLTAEDDLVWAVMNEIYAGDLKTFLAGPAGADQILNPIIKNVSQEVAFGELTPEEAGVKFMEESLNAIDR